MAHRQTIGNLGWESSASTIPTACNGDIHSIASDRDIVSFGAMSQGQFRS